MIYINHLSCFFPCLYSFNFYIKFFVCFFPFISGSWLGWEMHMSITISHDSSLRREIPYWRHKSSNFRPGEFEKTFILLTLDHLLDSNKMLWLMIYLIYFEHTTHEHVNWEGRKKVYKTHWNLELNLLVFFYIFFLRGLLKIIKLKMGKLMVKRLCFELWWFMLFSFIWKATVTENKQASCTSKSHTKPMKLKWDWKRPRVGDNYCAILVSMSCWFHAALCFHCSSSSSLKNFILSQEIFQI